MGVVVMRFRGDIILLRNRTVRPDTAPLECCVFAFESVTWRFGVLRTSASAGAVIGCYRVLLKLMTNFLRSLESAFILSCGTFPMTLVSPATETVPSICVKNENIT